MPSSSLKNSSRKKKQLGFTMIEVIVVIGVLTVIMVTSLFTIAQLNNHSQLASAKTTVTTALEESRNRAVNGYGTTDQGIYINSNQITLFQGSTYTSGGQTFVLPPSVSLSSSAATIVFKRITGQSSLAANITISNPSGSALINVHNNGSLGIQ